MEYTKDEAGGPSAHILPGEGRSTGRAARRFSEADIPGVADLHRRVSGVHAETTPALLTAYQRYFSRVFLDELWDGDGVSSLVYEDDRGAITGFLGVVPRRMAMDGTRLLAATSSQLVVDGRQGDPDRIGVELLRAFLQQPQDLSIADEAGDATRGMWEALGGSVAHTHSKSWIRILRPGAFSQSYLGHQLSLAGARPPRPDPRVTDAPASRPPRIPLREGGTALVAEEMCSGTFVNLLPALTGQEALRPDDDERTLRWALERVSAQGEWAEPEGVLLRTRDGRPMGAYFHYLDRAGIDQVLQLVAAPSAVDDVVGHLFQRASQEGAIAVEGRLTRHLAQALSRQHAIFHKRDRWVLFHSRRPDVCAALDRGEAVLSRLEGELCLRFWGAPAASPQPTLCREG